VRTCQRQEAVEPNPAHKKKKNKKKKKKKKKTKTKTKTKKKKKKDTAGKTGVSGLDFFAKYYQHRHNICMRLHRDYILFNNTR